MPTAFRIGNAALRLLLAPACAGCHQPLKDPLAGPICLSCAKALAHMAGPWCRRCGDRLAPGTPLDEDCARCIASPPSFEVARSGGLYQGTLRELIHAFKYERRRLLAGPLGRFARRTDASIFAGVDAVVPVPLHPLRSLRRGFNQADDLARELGLPVWRPLRRRRHGAPQASLPAPERHGNVENAFALSVVWTMSQPVRRRQLHGRTVLLVDDVMTTGATLNACARVLRDAGVSRVRALTVARAVVEPLPQPPPPRPPSGPRRR